MNLTAVSTLVGAISRTKETEQYKASLKRLQENLEQRRLDPDDFFCRRDLAAQRGLLHRRRNDVGG